MHGVMLLGLCMVALSRQSSAQIVRNLTLTSTVSDIGIVDFIGPLQSRQSAGSDANVTGTVRTKHNGPYLLQVRLATTHADTVLAVMPNGTHAMLGTVAWTTVAAGPGGARLTNSVGYLVRWGQGSPKRPQDAEAIPVTYRVIAP